MNIIPQRAFSRNNFSASVMYSKTDTDQKEFHEAKIVNCSTGGMYFVSDKALNPGENIHIKLTELSPDPYWPEASDQYFAEVRWCREDGSNGTRSYAVGVRFIQDSCSQCGNKILNNFSNDCGLCQDCHNHMNSLSDDNVKNCLSNYLLGNVL